MLFLCVFLSAPCLANNYNTGAYYFSKGDYVSAMIIWEPLAKQGNPAAQYSMGLLYDQGKGVEQDPQQALEFFNAAVEQNLSAAQYYLGIKYYAGLGMKQDTRKARELLNLAAEQDHLQSQFQLGLMYSKGEGGETDQPLAIYWWTRAAENGFAPAQHSLAAHYLTGTGDALNLKEGVFWLKKASEQQDADAMRDLGFLHYQGMGVDKDFQRANDLLLTPAEEGSALAQFILGEIYFIGGHGIIKNHDTAKRWYQLAQRSGNKDAQQRLVQMNEDSRNQTEVKASVSKTLQTSEPPANNATETRTQKALKQDAVRFKQISDQEFVLQIVQAQRYESISKLTRQYSDQNTYFFSINRETEKLYVLLYGPYNNYSEAQQAISQLPKTFHLKSKPWIRQVQNIKNQMP